MKITTFKWPQTSQWTWENYNIGTDELHRFVKIKGMRGGKLIEDNKDQEAINLGTGNTTDQATEIGSAVDPVD